MKNYLFITMLIINTLLYSCDVDCEKSLQGYRDYDIEVILTEPPTINAEMNFTGTKINSNEITVTKIMGRWYRNYRGYMEIGDNVIKKRKINYVYSQERYNYGFQS